MTRTLAIAARILAQFRHDRRTLALLFVAPLVVLWLLSVLLGADALGPAVATVNLPVSVQEAIESQDARVFKVDGAQARRLVEAGEVSAVLTAGDDGGLAILAEGSKASDTAAVVALVREALAEMPAASPAPGTASAPRIEITYLHGSESWRTFDYYGPIFIGIFLFVFVFITSGMSLVNEKSAGTMERFLATPVRPVEILGGYVLGFGALALVQAVVILTVALTVIGFPNEGSLGLVVLAAVSLAVASVTLGLLVSGLASSPFQVIQLMLVFVVPQILLCGLFDLAAAPGWLQALGNHLPLTYGVEALQSVMLRGDGFADAWPSLASLWAFIAAFFVLGALGFRKKRAR